MFMPQQRIKVMIGDFNAKVGREDIFKPTTGNESLHEISNDNGVRVVNFATSKNLIVKSTTFPHHKKKTSVALVRQRTTSPRSGGRSVGIVR
jgi:hypothetical protein